MSNSPSPSPSSNEGEKPTQIHLYIPRELYLIPLATTSTGLALGFLRGSRATSLRFLAENAHRPPKTLEEWYFYHKTKNYRVALGGLKQSGRDGLKFAGAGVTWVGLEEAAKRVGMGEIKEVLAGAGLAGLFSAVCKLFCYQNGRIDKLIGLNDISLGEKR